MAQDIGSPNHRCDCGQDVYLAHFVSSTDGVPDFEGEQFDPLDRRIGGDALLSWHDGDLHATRLTDQQRRGAERAGEALHEEHECGRQ
ncbi:hypothetical protein SAMN04487905_10646 [Actinopolyspora xinjiangensis]|uniref:Uncharacterized protein n=1 Tax=Actinopolyspora xinjiangensis TaxID=405564 RepID=A0A1H0U4M6_9ACTN|nr:hypothetical protein [Actinopolyspora xinjiangensis]SDP61124.1 hypothetical protein SAMN04487905_10646 [Actinopolyspora xinjiangensis]